MDMSDATPTTRRRWYQFSLRTMLLLMAIVAVSFSWIGYNLNLIRQRQEILRHWWQADQYVYGAFGPAQPVRAPGSLWLFGEQGYRTVLIRFSNADDHTELSDAEKALVVGAKALFPEAYVEGALMSDSMPNIYPGWKPQ
jgi:hypothetical protein